MWGMFGTLIGLQHKKKEVLLSVVRFQIFLRENKAILFFSVESVSFRSALFLWQFSLTFFCKDSRYLEKGL